VIVRVEVEDPKYTANVMTNTEEMQPQQSAQL